MSLSEIESEIIAKGLTAARVTRADVVAAIKNEHYFTAANGVLGAMIECAQPMHEDAQGVKSPLGLLTFCVLELQNGFTVTGESACVSPENFDCMIGRKIAYENAISKLWPLLGYALKDKQGSS